MILIYSESVKAKELRDTLAADGATVRMRNPQYFQPNETEAADEVWISERENGNAIFTAYGATGVSVKWIDNIGLKAIAEPDIAETDASPTPKRKRK